MRNTIYIKPMTWAGELRFYLGLEPSDPTRGHGYRLGGYFLVVDRLSTARAVAEDQARRTGQQVVECAHYVGL